MIFLPKAEDEIKFELTKKLQDSIVKYSVSYKWEIDSLIKMVINSKGKLYEDVLSNIILAILQVKDLYIYSAHKAFLALKIKKNENNPALAKLCIYIIGELANYLISNTTLNCKNEILKVDENDILHLLKEVGNKHNVLGNETVLEYLLNTLVKLFIKFKDKKSEIESMIKHYKRSYFSEVQSRALEYLQFNKSDKDNMKQKMVESIPLPQKSKEEDKSKEKRKLVDDKDEENYEPEDDLICVRLTEGVIKNIEIKNIEENENNNGLDFLGEKDNNENNNINNNQGGNLDLLDLNSIFSSASGNPDNNNANQNNENNNNNNNQAGNPFDILNMQLNQNNTNDNNNKKNNSDINDILNMVIGTNNNINNTNINNNINPNTNNPAPEHEINTMKECFKNDDISIYYTITKKEQSNLDGTIYATNNKNLEINNVKIIFQVQKFVKLNVLSVSGDKLDPNQSLGIKKDFTLTSSEPHKKVSIKIKLQYMINNEEKTEQFIIKNL